MADKVIFAEQTVEFDVSDGFGLIQYNGNPPFTLEAGKAYRVVWDETEYTCTAEAQETGLEEIVSIVMGNLTGETDYPPFQIAYVYNASGATESENVSIISIGAESTHTIAIYEVAAEDKQYLIYQSTLTGIAEAIRSKTGNTDTIKVSDMAAQIAGITTGGGESACAYYSGSFEATSNSMVVEHGCGVVPDVLVVTINAVPTAMTLLTIKGFSAAMLEKLGGGYYNMATFIASSGTGTMGVTNNVGIEDEHTSQAKYGVIRNATSTSFEVGGTTAGLVTGETYNWWAICGLT